MHRAKAIEKKGGGLEWGGGGIDKGNQKRRSGEIKKKPGQGARAKKKKKKFDLPPRGAGIFSRGPRPTWSER